MQRTKDVDPAEDAAGAKDGGFTAKCYGLMGLGWMVTKKLVVAGAAISSAPMVLPPLFVASALSLLFSVPSTAFLAWYAAADKLMRFLLPPVPAPLLLLPNAAGSMIIEKDKKGDVAEEREVITFGGHEPEPDETAVVTLGESGRGYDVPLEGGEEPAFLPAELMADSSGLDYTGDQPVPGQVDKGEGEEAPVIMIRPDGPVEVDETATLDEAGRGDGVLPARGGELSQLPSEKMVDSAALDYTVEKEVLEQVENRGEETPEGDGGRYDIPIEGGEMERLPAEAMADSVPIDYVGDVTVPEHAYEEEGEEATEAVGRDYDGRIKGGEEMDYQASPEFAALDYVGDQTMPEKVDRGAGEKVPSQADWRYDVPVEGGVDVAHLPAEERVDSAASDYACLAVPWQVKTKEEQEALDEAGGQYDVSLEGGLDLAQLHAEERADSAAFDYVGDQVMLEKVDKGKGEEVPNQAGWLYDVPVEDGVDVAHLLAEERVDSAALDYAYLTVRGQEKTGGDQVSPDAAGGQYDVSMEGGVDMAQLPAEERADSAALDYDYLAAPERVKTREDEEAVERLVSGQYDVPVVGGVDVARPPAKERSDSAEQISELQYPYGSEEGRLPGEGMDVVGIPDIHIRENEHVEHDQETVPPPAAQEASVEKDVGAKGEGSPVIAAQMAGMEENEPPVVPARPQTITTNERGTREESAAEKIKGPPVVSISSTTSVPALSQVEGPFVEVPVVMTAAVVGTNAAIVVQQEGLLIDRAPMSEKPVTPTVIPLAAATVPSDKEDAPPLVSAETMWEQIEALRLIIGYTVARQASLMEELKALYLFTGVEPPASYGDPSNLMDVGNQLQFLKSVVGVI